MSNDIFQKLVSPATGIPLRHINDHLSTVDETEVFQIKNGIACLTKTNNLDEMKLHEVDVFNDIPIQNTSYFRMSLFQNVMIRIGAILKQNNKWNQGSPAIVEMGGGEGHWARYIKKEIPCATVFVCDLSMRMLERAPKDLKKICADISSPIFEKNSIQIVSFWVSLHHLNTKDRESALKEAAEALGDGGILLVFEPNDMFFPRRVVYRTKLSEDVYFDKQEKALKFSEISLILKKIGLEEVGIYFINPPYNPEFIKKLKRWLFYMAIVEILYQVDKWILSPMLGDIFSIKQSRLKKYLSLYGLAIYRKRIT